MSYRWAYCRCCAKTMYITAFPLAEQRQIKRYGYGLCASCTISGQGAANLLETSGKPFMDYILEQHK